MRFEALNQLFKTFAKTGSFRNTCKRCADMWTIRVARDRDAGAKEGWGATRPERASAPMTYKRNSASKPPAAISLLLKARPRCEAIEVEWVHSLYHAGSLFTPGESWLSGVWDGTKEILGCIPNNGIFKFGGSIYCLLHVYPLGADATFGVPATTIADTCKPRSKLVKVGTARLTNLIPLWPSFRETKRGKTMYRFVPL